MSSRPKTVLVFGGAFDPPHNGHLHILKNAIDAVDPQLALVMPTGISPHKASSLTPAAVRRRMCRCFLSVDARVRICDHELRQKGKSYTVDTVAWLRRRYPGAGLVLAIGSDMLLTFERWRDWQTLLAEVTLCVQCRDDEDAAALETKAKELTAAGGRVLLCSCPALEISSTAVREKAAAGQDIRQLVPPDVARLVARHRLYQPLPEARDVARTVREALSPARWHHTQGVCRGAVRMARRFGADWRKARLAALLHDFLKEISEAQMLQIFADNGIMDHRPAVAAEKAGTQAAVPDDGNTAPAAQGEQSPAAPVLSDAAAPLPGPLAGLVPADITLRARPTWHGAAATLVAYGRFGIRDAEILSAVASHTCGRAGMGKLDKIVYLADMIGPERDFPGVDTLRRLCRQDLDAAMRWALDHNAAYQLSRGQQVYPESLAARRELGD